MDTERMACRECGTMNAMLGVVNQTRQYLCRKCGQVYYTPDTCLGTPAPPDPPPPGDPAPDDGEEKDGRGGAGS